MFLARLPPRSGPAVRFSNLWDRSTILADENVCDFIGDNPNVDSVEERHSAGVLVRRAVRVIASSTSGLAFT